MARKKVTEDNRITLVKIWVKGKNVKAATKAALLIEKKYR